MILGIGIDLLKLSRLHNLKSPLHRLANRILTPQELVAFSAATDQHLHLAVRWTAKEAAYKALYPAHPITWQSIAILKPSKTKKPLVEFTNPALNDEIKLHLSVSHDGDYVTAYVVAETIP